MDLPQGYLIGYVELVNTTIVNNTIDVWGDWGAAIYFDNNGTVKNGIPFIIIFQKLVKALTILMKESTLILAGESSFHGL